MTEEEWLASDDPLAMVVSLADYRTKSPGVRRLRLVAAHCCRNVLRDDDVTEVRHAIDTLERLADGQVTKREFAPVVLLSIDLARRALGVDEVLNALSSATCDALDNPLHAAYHAAENSQRAAGLGAGTGDLGSERAFQVRVLRDIFGNPFRPVAFSPEWRTDTAVSLARQMYESREFSAMPILADALQDAGCDNADILGHCRDPNATHGRGCWVVDLVLGKE